MDELAGFVSYLNLAAYVGLGLVALVQWRARRGRAVVWAALAFGALAVVVVLGQLLPEHPKGLLEGAVLRVDIALLLLFPYLLFRFTAAFDPPSQRLDRGLTALSAVMVLWTLALPSIPAEGDPRPLTFQLWIAGFLAHWSFLSLLSAPRLWLAGRGQPTVARRRVRLLALAIATLTVAIFVLAVGGEHAGVAVTANLLAFVAAIAFLLGLAPPPQLRLIWRRPEQRRLQDAVGELVALATTQEEVAARVLAPMADIVGARALAVRNAEGRIVGAHQVPDDVLAELEAGEDLRPLGRDRALEVAVPGGSVVFWTAPYAPFFGDDELDIVRSLGALTGLALDRVRLFRQERDARLALERADQIKSEFVALAAHELRTPVTSIHGFVETLHRLGDQIPAEQRDALVAELAEQIQRMALLVEQLLDLSRLDAEAVEISPERFRIRERIEEVVRATVSERAEHVTVAVEPDLEAVVDVQAFDRIVSNLVTNAFRYGEPPVVIEASQTDRHFRLAVEDRGPGVPGDFVAKLFERFTRSSRTRERARGTGLGLAIARSYARTHGGDLVFQPARPRGARFELVLPAYRNRPKKG